MATVTTGLVSLESLLSRYVTPGLTAEGFARRGRTYRRQAPNGNWALINFQGTAGTRPGVAERLFYVNVGVVAKAHLEYMDAFYGRAATVLPELGNAVWTDRIRPPEDVEYLPGPFRDDRWWYGVDEQARRVGQHLERIVPRQCLPTLSRLVDRAELLGEIGHRVAPAALVTLLVDDGPSPALDEALGMARAAGDSRVVDWAVGRLAENAARHPTAE